MARVTVEDCVDKVPNRFDLVMLAAHRAREISTGSPLTIDRDNDKNPVVALREIADETVDIDSLENALVQSLQKHVEYDEPDQDDVRDMIESESHMMGVDLGSPVDEDGAQIRDAGEDAAPPTMRFEDAAEAFQDE